jgi:hypothetical protein
MTTNPYQSPAVPDPMKDDEPIVESSMVETPAAAVRPLTAEGAFGVVVRGIGLILCVMAAWQAVSAILQSAVAYSMGGDGNVRGYGAYFIFYFAAGLVLMRGAPVIVQFAYPHDRIDDND